MTHSNQLPAYLEIIDELARAICREPDNLKSELIQVEDEGEINFSPAKKDCGFLIGKKGQVSNAFCEIADKLAIEYSQIRIANVHVDSPINEAREIEFRKFEPKPDWRDETILKPLDKLCGLLFNLSQVHVELTDSHQDKKLATVAIEGGLPEEELIAAINIIMNAIGSANGKQIKVKFESY
jgi:predicted RNA-binding protein YlqC (UPF0109 family)